MSETAPVDEFPMSGTVGFYLKNIGVVRKVPLQKTYSAEFERLYKAWPTWPKGRTKKHLAARAFEKAKVEFGLTTEDVDKLVLLIERMKKDRKHWQPGNQYGPQGLQVWLNQRGWMDDYETVNRKPDKFDNANRSQFTETHAEAMRKIEEAKMQRQLH